MKSRELSSQVIIFYYILMENSFLSTNYHTIIISNIIKILYFYFDLNGLNFISIYINIIKIKKKKKNNKFIF